MDSQHDDAPAPLARIQQNVLARAERRLLNWLCTRMPGWITPDLLTALGLVGAGAVMAGYALSACQTEWLWLSIAGYVLNWFGDSMDGSLARFRKCERPAFGYFIDHSCDALATLLIVAGIGTSPYVRLDVSLIAVAGYMMMSIHAFLSARVMGELQLSYLAGGPTELRIMLIGLTAAMMALGTGPGIFAPYSGFDVFVGLAGAGLIVLFIVQTLIVGRQLARSGG